MRILKWGLLGLLGLAALIVIGGYALSPRYAVTRSVVIAAPAEKIYPLVADPRAWAQWSVWNQRDPTMAITYSGPPQGAGAKWAWKSATEGSGEMSFTAAEPNQRVAFDLYFPDFGSTSTGELRFEPQGSGGTRVSWTMDGDMGKNPVFHWLALFGDKLVGPDFEAGLQRLKAVAEKA